MRQGFGESWFWRVPMWVWVIAALVIYAFTYAAIRSDCDKRGGTFVQLNDNIGCISAAKP